ADAGEHIAQRITQRHCQSSLPAGLDEAGDDPRIAEFTKRDARHAELAINGARATGHLAAIADAGLGAVARHRRQLELSPETLIERLRLIHHDRLQRLALGGIAGSQPTAVVVL